MMILAYRKHRVCSVDGVRVQSHLSLARFDSGDYAVIETCPGDGSLPRPRRIYSSLDAALDVFMRVAQ